MKSKLKLKRIENNGETLTFMRVAKKDKDGKDGLLYINSWATGFQELIFTNEDSAKRYLGVA